MSNQDRNSKGFNRICAQCNAHINSGTCHNCGLGFFNREELQKAIDTSPFFGFFYVTSTYNYMRPEFLKFVNEALHETGRISVSPCVSKNWIYETQTISETLAEVWILCSKGWFSCPKLHEEIEMLKMGGHKIVYIHPYIDLDQGLLCLTDLATKEDIIELKIDTKTNNFWAHLTWGRI